MTPLVRKRLKFALWILLAAIAGVCIISLDLTDQGRSAVIASAVFIGIGVWAMLTEGPASWWFRVSFLIATCLPLVCALFGLMGPMMKPDPSVALRAETEASQTLYTSKATVTNECLIFEPKAPEGIKAMAVSQVDSAVPRITHCEITVDWSRYSILAIPTRDGVSNLGDLESRVMDKTKLTFTAPYGTRVDLFLFEPDRPTYNIEKFWLHMPASRATANRY